MVLRSLKTERERGSLQGDRAAISAVRKPARRRTGGDARIFGRLKRAIRDAEHRSGDGREIGGTGATILRLQPAPLVRLIEKQRIGTEEIRAADDITTAFHAQAGAVIVLTNSPGAAGFQPPVGTGNVSGPGSSTAGHVATFADATGKVLQDGGTVVGGPNSITASMLANSAIAFGVGMLNGTLVASVAGNALTIAVKTLAGADPSGTDPVFFLMRDATVGYVVLEQTSALSITVPSGATLGTINGQANRIWVGVFNNNVTPVLGVYNSLNSSGPSIVPWDETSPANGTGITPGSTSPQIWYTASTMSAKTFRILGYVESTQATAGIWATSPSKVQLFGPGVKRPGDVVQEVANGVGGTATTSSATYVALTGQNVTTSVQSAANVIRAEAIVTQTIPGATNQTFSPFMSLSRGTVANTNLIGSTATVQESMAGSATVQLNLTVPLLAYDVPNTVGSITYAVQGKINSGTLTINPGSLIAARELQI